MRKRQRHLYRQNSTGDRMWYQYASARPHRDDGPAAEFADGTKIWYVLGEKHREDGPAVEFATGPRHYYWRGQMSSSEHVNGDKQIVFKIADRKTKRRKKGRIEVVASRGGWRHR